MEHPTAADILERELVIKRSFLAPRERVVAAWLDPDQLARWWGPRGFHTTIQEFEPEVGGPWRFILHGPEGVAQPGECRFVEVDAPERLVFDHVSQPPFRAIVEFEPVDGDTRLIFRLHFPNAAAREAARSTQADHEQAFERLAGLLAEG
ncbi:SRPBCC domain-containing protein [Geothrix sp. PMB-07]|uniref:SRPBCC domain-containing protein n=1 Tax=Geothrix sp. PMB-07 TaxID=3068640 RepID=UPI002741A176|nr:SRPBCC domain-containing protein [Geothrix sp. PMB-07]WLT32312.1 SRPBCC domain-containing protein [Geothrix sp. PMB-07]